MNFWHLNVLWFNCPPFLIYQNIHILHVDIHQLEASKLSALCSIRWGINKEYSYQLSTFNLLEMSKLMTKVCILILMVPLMRDSTAKKFVLERLTLGESDEAHLRFQLKLSECSKLNRTRMFSITLDWAQTNHSRFIAETNPRGTFWYRNTEFPDQKCQRIDKEVEDAVSNQTLSTIYQVYIVCWNAAFKYFLIFLRMFRHSNSFFRYIRIFGRNIQYFGIPVPLGLSPLSNNRYSKVEQKDIENIVRNMLSKPSVDFVSNYGN